MARVLVTGGAGFIGAHVVRALEARGDEVAIVDLSLGGDIRDRRTVRRAMGEVVVHLAARPGVRASTEDPRGFAEVNVDGTRLVLEEARRAGVRRFVFASSSSVYGVRPPRPFVESDPLAPASPYAATKLAGERLCRESGLPSTALRLFSVLGPGQRRDMALAIFADRARRGLPLELFGDGSSARDYTHVFDVTRAIIRAADLSTPGFEAINVGAGRAVSLLALARRFGRPIVHRPVHPADVPYTCADNRKARRLLGWRPCM